MTKPALHIHNLNVWHDSANTKRIILTNVNLDLNQGDFLCVIGMSGGGKSTMLRALCGLLPQGLLMSYDSYTLMGQAVRQASMSKHLGKYISIVFQDPYSSLNPTLTIGRQFELSLRGKANRKYASQFIKEEAIKRLYEVEIADPEQVLGRFPAELSGGMNQRINIALALINDPEVLLLDEPTSALDKNRRDGIITVLRDIKRMRNLSVIFVTHDISLVRNIADEIAIIHSGEITKDSARISKGHIPKKALSKTIIASSDLKIQNPQLDQNNDITLTVRNISKKFGNNHDALCNISLILKMGESLGIIGPSGGGKSTLAKIISGYLVPSSGSVVTRRNLRVELVAQAVSESLNPYHTARTVLNEERIIQWHSNHTEKELYYYFTLFNLPATVLTQPVGYLSGGQQQRIAIIRALLAAPDVLILDEPTSALDIQTQQKVLTALMRFRKQRELSYIVLSHDRDVINYMCDRFIEVDQSIINHGFV